MYEYPRKCHGYINYIFWDKSLRHYFHTGPSTWGCQTFDPWFKNGYLCYDRFYRKSVWKWCHRRSPQREYLLCHLLYYYVGRKKFLGWKNTTSCIVRFWSFLSRRTIWLMRLMLLVLSTSLRIISIENMRNAWNIFGR